MTVPFATVGEVGVNARVAIALLKCVLRKQGHRYVSPSILIGCATARLEGLACHMLRGCLISLNAYIIAGGSSSAWLTGVLYREAMGYTFRRCLYSEYKATRRARPPC